MWLYKTNSALGTPSVAQLIPNATDYGTWQTVGADGGVIPPGAAMVQNRIELVATNTVSGNVTVDMSPLGIKAQ